MSKRAFITAVCVLSLGAGMGWAYAPRENDVPSPKYQNRPHSSHSSQIEIYATSQEKPQSLSGAPFKAGDSETFGIKDTSKKGLPVAAHLSPHLNPPPQGGRKEGGEERDLAAAVFTPLLL